MTTTRDGLAQALTAAKLVITAECLPPAGSDPGAVRDRAAALPQALDAIVIPDNAEDVHCSALACAAILAGEGRPVVVSMVTRDRNRIALESDALGAMAVGVSGILALSGNHQSLGSRPQAAGVYDIDSIQFAQALKRMCVEGVDFNGQGLQRKPAFVIGAVAHPALQPLELNLLRLRKKVAAGVDFVLAEASADLEGFTRWMEAVCAEGLDRKAAILAAIPVDGGAELAAQLKSVPGVRGIHILCGGREEEAAAILRDAGLPGGVS
jgi:methylenetetrahydrofolate reductase (NADPH)